MGYKTPHIYTIPILSGTTNYGDAVTAYLGHTTQTPTTTAGVRKVYFLKAGTIRAVFFYTHSQNVTGTAENWPWYIRINNTTDYALTPVAAATPIRDHSITGLNIPVTTSDYFEIKTVTPTWVTNPDSTFSGGYVLIECE